MHLGKGHSNGTDHEPQQRPDHSGPPGPRRHGRPHLRAGGPARNRQPGGRRRGQRHAHAQGHPPLLPPRRRQGHRPDHPSFRIHFALSPFPNAKTLVGSVTDALKIGADAVSVHVNLGDETEPQMLADLGALCSEANEWGMPVLAMMYARGPKIENEYDPGIVAHCARVGVELGADIVKVNYTGDPRILLPRGGRMLRAGGHRGRPQAGQRTRPGADGLRLHPGGRFRPVRRPQHLPAPQPEKNRGRTEQGRPRGLGRGSGYGSAVTG